MIEETNFGTTKCGKKISIFTLSSEKLTVEVINFGAVVKSMVLKDMQGVPTDVVLGYDTLAEYEVNIPYLGATIGRCTSRIANGQFELEGKRYQLPVNNGENSLHGGLVGFSHKVWDAEVVGDNSVKMTYLSVDGEEGYPGNLTATVTFTIKGDQLEIDYKATTDQTTVVNLTNHSYFNLNGGGSIKGQLLQINCAEYLPLSSKAILTGEVKAVADTPFDFTTMKPMGQDIEADVPMLKENLGYDLAYLCEGDYSTPQAVAFSKETGITLTVYTQEPTIHLYTGNFLNDVVGKGGVAYADQTGFCLETQQPTDAINQPNFKSPILKPGELYSTKTIFQLNLG